MRNKARFIWTVVLIGVLGLSTLSLAATSALTGREIIEKVDAAVVADDATSLMTMTLTNDRGESLVRGMWSWKQGTAKTALVFVEPEDVKGTAFLNVQGNDDANDEMWLYLPSLELTKHIDSDSKSQNFMGSDFTYDDMGDRNIDDYDYTLLREEIYDGQHVLVVEGIAINPQEASYSKLISWIRDDIWMPVQVEYYDLRGDLEKVQTNSRIEEIDGYWAVTKMEMENIQTNHSTIMETTHTELNTGIPAEVFTSKELPNLLSRVTQ
ncbi:MAG: outer membrane lipoprotein-sorting protein [Candidatus Bipolaricaulota bacterium]|nr:outer membrane lipoprotein-sorting protein [Candidatus Bipolaricaulota bacterium]